MALRHILVAIMLFLIRRSLSLLPIRQHCRCRTLSSLYTTPKAYSIEDLYPRDGDDRRQPPPTLFDDTDNDLQSAYGYQLDEHDIAEMERQEQIEREFFNKKTEGKPKTTEKAPAVSTSSPSSPAVQHVPTTPFANISEPVIPKTHFHAAQVSTVIADGDSDSKLSSFVTQASTGDGATTTLDVLSEQLEQLTLQAQQEANDPTLNLNSTRQVARAMFGPEGGSTEKSFLEAMAASGASGHHLADLVLKYRSVQQQIRRLERSQKSRAASSTTTTSTMTDDPLLLIDASSYIFRAYYSMPPIHRSDGMPTGAVMGFCNMLHKLVMGRLLQDQTPRLVLVFDSPGATFRHALYPDYKGHRPDAPLDLIPQFALVRQAAAAYGMPILEAPTFEADDVIATLAEMAIQEGIPKVSIFSGDKDLMQLVQDPYVQMIDPATLAPCTTETVIEKWGVTPSQLGDVLALAGDAADNVPGVPGIGPKIAAQLMQEYGSLDNLLENVDMVKQKKRREKLLEFEQQARLSRKLVELDRNVPKHAMTFPDGVENVGDLRVAPLDPDRILAFFDEMGFQDIKRRFLNALGVTKKRPPSRKLPKAKVPKPEDFSDVPF